MQPNRVMANDLEGFLATMVGDGPAVEPATVAALVRDHYGFDAQVERLSGERDENFRIRWVGGGEFERGAAVVSGAAAGPSAAAGPGAEFVLKVANACEDALVSALPTAVLLHVEQADPLLPCPRVCRTRTGSVDLEFEDAAGRARTARLVTFLAGKRLASASRSPQQRAACGRVAARLARALRAFEHPASHRPVIWDLKHLPKLGALLEDLPRLPESDFISRAIAQLTAEVAPCLAQVRHQFVHNDLNVGNVLVDEADETRVTGIIDFGDAVHTARIADVAIALVGQITNLEAAHECIGDFLRAYHEVEPLDDEELAILNWLVAARILQGVVIPSWHRAKNPLATHFPAFDADHIRRRTALARHLIGMRITL